MDTETLVHSCNVQVSGDLYEVQVYSRADGSFIAKTAFAADDVIINDGPSLDEALERHRRLLPLAIDSRVILKAYRRRPLS